ncbi:hyalin-like [Antedon mediterranea]|uniref:hyalin-like n=1 Tax=Antedon mediterranea TaxID=105859 RepID=UPI003AF50DC8
MLLTFLILILGISNLVNSQITFDNCTGDEGINNTGAFPYAYTIPVITATVNSSGLAADVQVTSRPAYVPGTVVNFGVDEVLNLQYTALAAGETGVVCEFSVMVFDIGNPNVISYPVNVLLSTDPGQSTALYNWTAPFAIDNSNTVIVSYETNGVTFSNPSYNFPIGLRVVKVNVSDPSGNSVSGMFTVTVEDTEDPSIICPTNSTNSFSSFNADIWTIHTDSGENFATVTWDPPSVSDNSGDSTLSEPTFSSGNMFNVGVNYTIVYNVSDPSGNRNTCSFTIRVEDHEGPVITCPMPLTISNTQDASSGIAVWVIQATDNVEVASLLEDSNAIGSFTPGLNTSTHYTKSVRIGAVTVNFTATDSFGNIAECSVHIIVRDEQAPHIIDCPIDFTANTTTGEVFATNITWVSPTSTDNSGETLQIESEYTSGDNMFPIGNTTVHYNVSDSSGNFNYSCSFVITVEDNERPMIDCPTNVTSTNYIGEGFGLLNVRTDQGSQNSTVTWDPSVTSDNSNETVTVLSSPYESGDMIPIGTHTITFTATDPYGNFDTCDFYIVVEDVEPPTPICPSIIYGMIDPENPNVTVSFNITVVDNVLVTMFDTNYTLVYNPSRIIDLVSYNFESTGVFPIGETIIEYTFLDNASPISNQASCYVKVIITGGPCDTDLVLTEWQRSILYDLGSESPISDDFIIDGWYKLRNEGERIDIRMPTSTPGSFKCGTLFPVWIDDTYPELGDPIKSVTGCIDVNGDPCALTVPISLLACSTVNNDLYFVHYFVDTPGTLMGYCTDSFLPCKTNLTSSPEFPPCDVTFDNCPEDETIHNTGAFPYAYTIPVITATVNSSGLAADVQVTSTPAYVPGTVLNFGVDGVLNLQYKSSTAGETNIVCEFSVTFLDTGDPYYPDCPTEHLVFNTNDSSMAEARWTDPVPTDASIGSISESMQTKPYETSPAYFPIGETNLNYTATDGSGNTGFCIIIVEVIDIGDPIVTSYPINALSVLPTDHGRPTAFYNWTAPVATDNSGTVFIFYETHGVTFSHPSYNFPIGVSVVTVNVSDPSGNSVSGMFTVTVQAVVN